MQTLTAGSRALSAEGLCFQVPAPALTPAAHSPDQLVNIVPAGWGTDDFVYEAEGASALSEAVFTVGSGTVLVAVNDGAFGSVAQANGQIAAAVASAPDAGYRLVVRVSSDIFSAAATAVLTLTY